MFNVLIYNFYVFISIIGLNQITHEKIPLIIDADTANELDDYPFELSTVYKERRELVVENLKELDFIIQESDATMFVWAKLPERFNKDSLKFSLDILLILL